MKRMEFGLDKPLVDIQNLTFRRGERVIYDDMSMQFQRGKVTAIMGPSGIGKTTLLRLIGGQLKPDSGKILFEGANIPTLGRQELYQARKKMSMLFQSGALFTEMSVFDNVAFPIREHTRLPEAIIRTMVLMKLEAVGLRGARDLMPAELSGGMGASCGIGPRHCARPAIDYVRRAICRTGSNFDGRDSSVNPLAERCAGADFYCGIARRRRSDEHR